MGHFANRLAALRTTLDAITARQEELRRERNALMIDDGAAARKRQLRSELVTLQHEEEEARAAIEELATLAASELQDEKHAEKLAAFGRAVAALTKREQLAAQLDGLLAEVATVGQEIAALAFEAWSSCGLQEEGAPVADAILAAHCRARLLPWDMLPSVYANASVPAKAVESASVVAAVARYAALVQQRRPSPPARQPSTHAVLPATVPGEGTLAEGDAR